MSRSSSQWFEERDNLLTANVRNKGTLLAVHAISVNNFYQNSIF